MEMPPGPVIVPTFVRLLPPVVAMLTNAPASAAAIVLVNSGVPEVTRMSPAAPTPSVVTFNRP